jgi:sulfatase modifying factor 1
MHRPGREFATRCRAEQLERRSGEAQVEGLHDLHGNVFERCRDWHHAKLPGGVDPDLYSARSTALRGDSGRVSRVRRGGCWADEGWPCRSAFRLRFEPERRAEHIGFRVAAVPP